MRLLTFLARRFAWEPFAPNLPPAPDAQPAERPPGGDLPESLVAFIHCEPKDVTDEARDRAIRHAVKHLKWHAGKRATRSVVLHSFAHLGADAAPADLAEAVLRDIGQRLSATGFTVRETPFGYTNAWSLDVYGDGNAKIWKEI